MIIGFRHKGLEHLYNDRSQQRVSAAHANKIRRILSRLDIATDPGHMNLPAFRLHPLKGNLKGYWSVNVSGNWRIVFRFKGMNVCDVDLVDYH